MIVLDASAALELLLVTPTGAAVARIVGRTGDTLHAPHLIDLEGLQVVRRLVRSDQLTRARAAQALADLAALRVQRYGHLALAPRIWGSGRTRRRMTQHIWPWPKRCRERYSRATPRWRAYPESTPELKWFESPEPRFPGLGRQPGDVATLGH